MFLQVPPHLPILFLCLKHGFRMAIFTKTLHCGGVAGNDLFFKSFKENMSVKIVISKWNVLFFCFFFLFFFFFFQCNFIYNSNTYTTNITLIFTLTIYLLISTTYTYTTYTCTTLQYDTKTTTWRNTKTTYNTILKLLKTILILQYNYLQIDIIND